MSSCDTCNQEVYTRWPHLPPQNVNVCSPLGCTITGRSAPESDFRYPNQYKTGPFQGSLRDSSLGKIQIGRKQNAPLMQTECCERFQNDRLGQVNREASASTEATTIPIIIPQMQTAAAPTKLGFDAASFLIGGFLGLFGGIFIWTATGRGVAYDVGQRARKHIRR